MKSRLTLIVALVMLVALGQPCLAESIQLEPHKIDLVSSSGIVGLLPGPIVEQWEIQGQSSITVNDPEGVIDLTLKLKRLGSVKKAPWEKVALQYQVVWGPVNASGWSDWIALDSLPVTIPLREMEVLGAGNNAPKGDPIVVFLQYRVPQSVALRHGEFHAHIEVYHTKVRDHRK